MYTSDENQQNTEYSLTLGNRFSWRLSGDSGVRDWLESFANVLNLRSGNAESYSRIHFVSRRSRWGWSRNLRTLLDAIPGDYSSSLDWKCRDFPRLRLWYQTDTPDVICELRLSKRRADAIILMSYAIHALYYGLALRGGFPLHSALIEKDRIGILLVGNEGIGKSTCCRRLPDTWNVKADDSVVVVPGPAATSCAHPFPTWSELLNRGPNVTWDVQRPVRLVAAMFLSRADQLEITPLGRGRAAVMMTASASYMCGVGRQAPRRFSQIEFRRRLFLNACAASSVPCFSLKLSPDGAFWEKIQDVIGNVQDQ